MKIHVYTIWIDHKKRLALYFRYDTIMIDLVKGIWNSRWNRKDKFWHIPYRDNYLDYLNGELPIEYEAIAGLKKVPRFFIQEKRGDIVPPEFSSYLNEHYSYPTYRKYRYTFADLLYYYPDKHPDEITIEEIRMYIIHVINDRNYAVSSQNQVINAIKSYYQNILGLVLDPIDLPRPKRPRKLPSAVSEDDVTKIFREITNLKHKCMVYLIYSCGLRLTELVHIKKEHLDLRKRKILITSPRPKENRFVGISIRMNKMLNQYLKTYDTETWLFEGYPGKQLLRRTLQRAFHNAVLKSGITKIATLSILRNSYAVHLIERGVDIRYIQRMMGHKSTKTTMRFLSISSRDFRYINSPLDNLNLEDEHE